MEEKQRTVFREESLKRAQDPEQLSSYLKLTGYREWVVVVAAALMLAAVFVWFFCGKIRTTVSGAGYNTDGVFLCYFSREDTEGLAPGAELNVSGTVFTVTDVDKTLFTASDIPNEILYYLPETRWYTRVEAVGDELADGLYQVSFIRDSDPPVSALSNGR